MLWMLMFLLLFGLYWLSRQGPGTEISYSQLKTQVRADNVAEVTFQGRTITGTFKKPLPEKTSAKEAGAAHGDDTTKSAPAASKPESPSSSQSPSQSKGNQKRAPPTRHSASAPDARGRRSRAARPARAARGHRVGPAGAERLVADDLRSWSCRCS